MKFSDFLKKFFLFTLKETYSFFLKLMLFFLIFFILGLSTISIINSKIKSENKQKGSDYVLFNVSKINEDKGLESSFLSDIINDKYNISYADLLNSLDKIKNDRKVKGIIIDLDQTQLSSSKIEEISKKMEELKKNNKKIYAYGAYLENGNYNLASVANEIIMTPSASASISLNGYQYSDLYFKNLMDKVGVNMEIVRIGSHKSYGENYTSNQMSPELKADLTRIFEDRYNNFITTIAKARKINKDILNTDIENGNTVNMSPFTARDKNFIDKLESYQDFIARLGITDKNITDIYDYFDKNVKGEETKGKNGTIAVIYAEGSIVYDDDGTKKNIISPNNISMKINKALETKNLKGIVLRVNSGGGSALASEIIYQQFSKVNVPIYVSMGDTAASGGYYISMVGSKVFANKATITGSIGVVSMIPKFYNTQNKFGVTSNSITKGKYADINDNFSPLSEESKAKISQSMTETYNEFKSRVIKNRKINDDKLEEYAQGRIWLGDEAKNIHLVDNIASLDEVIKIMAKDLNLGDNYNVSNIFVEEDLTQKLKVLTTFISEKLNIKSQLKESIPESEKVFEDYDLATKNTNKPLYYMPYNLKIY